jgi:hypothetical protein
MLNKEINKMTAWQISYYYLPITRLNDPRTQNIVFAWLLRRICYKWQICCSAVCSITLYRCQFIAPLFKLMCFFPSVQHPVVPKWQRPLHNTPPRHQMSASTLEVLFQRYSTTTHFAAILLLASPSVRYFTDSSDSTCKNSSLIMLTV